MKYVNIDNTWEIITFRDRSVLIKKMKECISFFKVLAANYVGDDASNKRQKPNKLYDYINSFIILREQSSRCCCIM